jgi:TRAP-type mannitol/chloroaromatic compound transport system permease small subunit
MKPLDTYLTFIEKINTWFGKIFSWIVLLLMVLTVLEVILRRFFNSPTIWSFEMCTHLFGLNFMIASAFTLMRDGHVSVDIFRSKLLKKNKALLDIFCYIVFFFPFTIVMLWKGIDYSQISWATRETSWSVFAPPLYPIKTVIPLTFLLLILQGVVNVIKRVLVLNPSRGDFHD